MTRRNIHGLSGMVILRLSGMYLSCYAAYKEKFLKMIRKAQREIIIETPYFLPTWIMRTLNDQYQKVWMSKLSCHKDLDVKIVNILSKHYLGRLHEAGVKIFYYNPTNLHTKMMMADDEFYVGSSNFDYRSFRYMFEIDFKY
ncbi:MAG: phospholipase D-like domain-containing protein [Sphingobacterium sp.]|nr:phospholipase D-like domain-containing protein [Sphingobacterium sp.]